MSLLFEEIPLSPKLELYRANQDQIRNQRPRLRRNRLFLGRKGRDFVYQYPICLTLILNQIEFYLILIILF